MNNKLLLADDSITIRKVVGIIFANEDYILSVVDNGNAALEKAREIIPDIILADVLMPGNTGYEVCAEVRRDPVLKDIPILLLTGAFEPFDEKKARESGADDFISKPFESQHLIDKVMILADLNGQRTTAAPAPAGVPEFQLEVVEGSADDDLWGAFELEDLAEGESSAAEESLFGIEVLSAGAEESNDTFVFSEVETPAAEAVEPQDYTPKWEPVAETVFSFADSGASHALEIAPDEQFGVFDEEATPLLETVPESSVDFFADSAEPATPEFFIEASEPEIGFEFAADEEYQPVSGELTSTPTVAPLSPDGGVFECPSAPGGEFMPESEALTAFTAHAPPAAALATPGFDLQFAPEEEYMPAPEALPAVPPPVPVAPAGAVLSDDQMAALVSRISRDIIEKIAWEVVPDLAERIILEEIRKIKEGV